MVYTSNVFDLVKVKDGTPGTPGKPGEKGDSLYTWVAYANADGLDDNGQLVSPSDFSTEFSNGRAYIGIAVNKTTQEESQEITDYKWSKIRGEQGESGKDANVYSIRPSSEIVLKFYETVNDEKILKFSPEKLNFPLYKRELDTDKIVTDKPLFKIYIGTLGALDNSLMYRIDQSSIISQFLKFVSNKESNEYYWTFDIKSFCSYDDSANEVTYPGIINDITISEIILHNNLTELIKSQDVAIRVEETIDNSLATAVIQSRFGLSSEMAQLQVNATNIRLFVENTGVTIDGSGMTLENGLFKIIKKTKNEQGKEQIEELLTASDGNLVIQGELNAKSIISGSTLKGVNGSFDTMEVLDHLQVGNIFIGIDGSEGLIKDIQTLDDGSKQSNFIIHDNGLIEANNIYLGTAAKIVQYLQIGDSFIYNPEVYKQNGVEEHLFIASKNLKIYDTGMANFGDIIVDSDKSTITCNNNDLTQWKLSPDESIFNNVYIRGYLKQSVFTQQAINVAGGITVFKTGARIEAVEFDGNASTIKIYLKTSAEDDEDLYGYFSVGNIAMLSNDQNDNCYVRIIDKVEENGLRYLQCSYITQSAATSFNLITNLGSLNADNQGQEWIIGVNATSSDSALGLKSNTISFNSFKITESTVDFINEITLGDLGGSRGKGLYAENVYLKGSLTTQSSEGDSNRFSGINTISKANFNQNIRNYLVKPKSETTPKEGIKYYLFDSVKGYVLQENLIAFEEDKVYYTYGYDESPIIFWAGASGESVEEIQQSPFQVTARGTLFAQQGYFRGSIITEADIQASVIHTAHIVGDDDDAALLIEDKNNFISFIDTDALDENGNKQSILSLKKDDKGEWVMNLNAKFQLSNASTGDLSGNSASFKILDVGEGLNEQNMFVHIEGDKIGFKNGNNLDYYFLYNKNSIKLIEGTDSYIIDFSSQGTKFYKQININENSVIYNKPATNDYKPNTMEYNPVYSNGIFIGYDLYIEEQE